MSTQAKKHVLVTNTDVVSKTIVEIDRVIAAAETVDLMDDTNPGGYYNDAYEALRAINDLEGTSLYAGVHARPPYFTVKVVLIA